MTRRSAILALASNKDTTFPPNHCPVCGLDCGPAPKYEPLSSEDVGRWGPMISLHNISGSNADGPVNERNEARRKADKSHPNGVLSECPRCHAAFFRSEQ